MYEGVGLTYGVWVVTVWVTYRLRSQQGRGRGLCSGGGCGRELHLCMSLQAVAVRGHQVRCVCGDAARAGETLLWQQVNWRPRQRCHLKHTRSHQGSREDKDTAECDTITMIEIIIIIIFPRAPVSSTQCCSEALYNHIKLIENTKIPHETMKQNG